MQIRVLVGAHEEGHNFSIHGIKWLFEPSEPNSGYRNSQMMGISEHFEFIMPAARQEPRAGRARSTASGRPAPRPTTTGTASGASSAPTPDLRPDLEPLPDNPNGRSDIEPGAVGAFDFSCPKNAPVRSLRRHGRRPPAPRCPAAGWSTTPHRRRASARCATRPRSSTCAGRPRRRRQAEAGRAPGPSRSILRAKAGECIKLTLRNRLLGDAGSTSTASTPCR